jgi:hypothetical protein
MRGRGVEFLNFSLEKINSQTYKDIQIVISDHSLNNDIKRLCDYWLKKLNIKYLKNEDNRGSSSANINNAIENSDGDIIKILFQDDFLFDEYSIEDIVNNFSGDWLITPCLHTSDGMNFFNPIYPYWNDNIHLGVNTISSPSVLTISKNVKERFDNQLIWLMDCDYYKKLYINYNQPIITKKINVVNRLWGSRLSDTIPEEIKDNELKIIKKNMENIKTYVMCHNQDIIIDCINRGKYNKIGEHKFLFLGFGDTTKIENNDKVIICRNLKNNIEENKNCLQYCAWYAVYNNDLFNDEYIRFIDYDINIIDDFNVNKKVKGTVGFNNDFYFKGGFGESDKFNNDVINYCGKNIDELIDEYEKKYNITKWFSSIDTTMHIDFFRDFMGWFNSYYSNNKDNFYFGMHFERFLMVYCMYTLTECEITKNETKHEQLMSHIYY